MPPAIPWCGPRVTSPVGGMRWRQMILGRLLIGLVGAVLSLALPPAAAAQAVVIGAKEFTAIRGGDERSAPASERLEPS